MPNLVKNFHSTLKIKLCGTAEIRRLVMTDDNDDDDAGSISDNDGNSDCVHNCDNILLLQL